MEVPDAGGTTLLSGYAFLLPTLVAVALFTVYPLFNTVYLSFTNSNGVTGDWVGLENYRATLADSQFWQALWNTLYIGLLAMLVQIPLSLVIATLINSAARGAGLFKAFYFSPNVTSGIASALAFTYLLYPDAQGWLNTAIGWLGLEPQRWFADPALARQSVVIMSVWHGLGYTTLIWLAALQSISKELHEAAAVDGAGSFKRWLHITVPGLRPITFFIVVVQTIGMFQRFTDVYQIGGADGQPGGKLSTLMIYIYRVGFNNFDFGRASAAGLLMFVLIIIATAANFLFGKEKA